MNKVINRIKNLYSNKLELTILLLLVIQIVFIVIVNFVKMPYFMDFDSSPTMVQTMKMWQEKSLFLKDWYYTTTLVLDSSLILAVPLFGLIGNVFTAFALANCIFLCLFIYMFNRIAEDINMSKGAKYFSMILLLTPYTIGQLEYLNMMFASQASYNVRALLPLILISILIRCYKGKGINKQKFISIIFLILLFISSISSSIYAFVSCVIPLLAYVVLYMIIRDNLKWNELKRPEVYFTIAALVVAAAGFFISKSMALTTVVEEETLVRTADFADNMFNCVLGIFAILGGLKDGDVIPVLSRDGIFMLIRFGFVSLFIFSFIFMLVRWAKKKTDNRYIPMSACVVFINLLILFLADTSYGSNFEHRYLLVLILPLFLCVGMVMDIIINEANASVRKAFIFTELMLITLCNCNGFREAFLVDNDYDDLSEIVEYMRNEYSDIGIANVIVSSNLEITENEKDGRIMQSAAPVDYIVISDGGIMNNWGQSAANLDNSYYSGKTLILTQGQVFDTLPDYLRHNVEMVQQFEYNAYQLYVAEDNKFDLLTGFPVNGNEKSIDFPYTAGYDVRLGHINENGELETIGVTGDAFAGELEGIAGTYDITFNYSFISNDNSNQHMYFSVTTEEEHLDSEVYGNNTTDMLSTTISNVKVQDEDLVELNMWVDNDTNVKLKSIEFTKKN